MKVLEAQPYLSVECSGIISLILRYKLYNCAVDRGWMLLFVYYCLGNVETMLFFSVAQSFLTLCNPMDCSIQASDPISRSLPSSRPLHEWCLSSHLILCWALLFSIFPSIRDLSNELAVCIRWPKYWSFTFSISPSKEYSGLISLKIYWFDLLPVHGTFSRDYTI